jgi:hypothetical protein
MNNVTMACPMVPQASGSASPKSDQPIIPYTNMRTRVSTTMLNTEGMDFTTVRTSMRASGRNRISRATRASLSRRSS